MTNFFSVRTAPKLAAWAMLAILALMWLSLKNLASDPVTALDFEDLPESTIVQMQYTNRGVVLPNPGIIVTAQPPAHSGRQLLQAWIGEDFNYTGPFVIRFTSGQARVKLFAGASDRTPGVTIRNSRPHALRIAFASCTEATTPSTPAAFASFASFSTLVLGVPPIPVSRIVF